MAQNIYQRVNAVMKEVDYIQKDATVGFGKGSYQGVTHDQVIAVVRPALIKHGIVIEPHLVADRWTEPRKHWEKSTNWLYEGFYHIHFVNIDSPEDRITMALTGHANDSGDKAPGKAVSYAVKTAILKICGIETGINDEARFGEKTVYTDEQKEIFDELILAEDAQGLYAFVQAMGDEIYTALYNSFEDGQKQAKKKKCKDLVAAGAGNFAGLVENIQSMIDANDVAVLELTDELNPQEKRLLVKRLREGDVQHLAKLKEAAA